MKHASLSALSVLLSVGAVACGATDPAAPAGAAGGPGMIGAGGAPAGQSADPCGLHTAFAGDQNCIPKPAYDEGVQVHIGPSSYDDPAIINAKDAKGNYLWLMMPGDERTECYHTITENDVGRYYFKQQYRMRSGSHHMIVSKSNSTATTEGWGLCSGGIIGSIGGTQNVVEDLPPGGIVAPEDEGLGRGLDPHSPLDVQLHFYNTTEQPRLREMWVNYIYKPKAEVITNLGMLGGFAPLNVPAHSSVTTGNVCRASDAIPSGSPVRIVTLFGHAHTHNQRFVVYHEKPGPSGAFTDGTSDVVYDSYDHAEAPQYTFNTVVKNPVPDPVNHVSGALSGILTLQPGEQIRYSCDIVNDTFIDFHGQNEVYTDEMCNLFGSVATLGMACPPLTVPTGTPTPAKP
jgi:hypothetical protein